MRLWVVILAICCTFSTVASEHPCTHEEGSAHRQPLRSLDGPGARHQVSFPHVGDQPHPLLQLPSWGHAGEWGAVRGLQTLQHGDPQEATFCRNSRGLQGERWSEQIVTWFVWCIWSDTFRIEWQRIIVLKLSALIVGLSPFLFTQVVWRVFHVQKNDSFAKS